MVFMETVRLLFLCGWMTFFTTLANGQNFGLDSNIVDYGNPKKYTIASTEIRGVKSPNIDLSSLIVRTGLTPGLPLTVPGEDFSLAIKSLWKMRLFSSVNIVVDKILGDQIWIGIEVEELRYYILMYLFWHIHRFQHSENLFLQNNQLQYFQYVLW